MQAFIATNLAISGMPLVTFLIFTTSTCIFSLALGLLIALGGAVLFTVSCAGFALLFLVPTVVVTTSLACFLFCCGLIAYYLLQWAGGSSDNGARRQSGAATSYDLARGWSKEFRTNGVGDASRQGS